MLKASSIAYLLKNDLSDPDPLVITPCPNVEKLARSGATSVDLHLGSWFITLRRLRTSLLEVIDPTSPSATEARLAKKHYVPFGERFILHPGCFVLGITLEWVRLKNDLCGFVIGKSSWGRRGLIIATATGVHPGFTGCLALEMTNVGEIPIEIRPGWEICQLFLDRVQPYDDKEPHDEHIAPSSFSGKTRPVLGSLGRSIRLENIPQKLPAQATTAQDKTPS